jgi:hypothetical protein
MSRVYVIIASLICALLAGCRDMDRTTAATRVQPVPAAAVVQISMPEPIAFNQPAAVPVDLKPQPLPHIPVGAVIGDGPPPGWSHLVLMATPTLTEEDQRDTPRMAAQYAQMFKFTILANVSRASPTFRLDKVALGFATRVNGRETVINGKETLDAELGLFGRRVLAENETIVDRDVLQIARTETMCLFDAQTVMRVGTEHVRRVMRHAVLVNPATGQLSTVVWLLVAAPPDGYQAAEKQLQLLPPGTREARLLSVKRDQFTLGMPTPEAFALRRIPQGIPVPYTPDLESAAAVKHFSADQVCALETQLRAVAARIGDR